MGNLFDNLQKSVFKTVQKTMGYALTWLPLAGGLQITANVLFKDATEREKILDQPYDVNKVMIEFHKGDLDALVTSVRKFGKEELVTINGISYGVLQIISKYDGKSYYAELQKQ